MKKILVLIFLFVIVGVITWIIFYLDYDNNFITYVNKGQSFQIKIPAKSVPRILRDTEAGKSGDGNITRNDFYATFETPDIEFLIRKNYQGEITPPFLPGILPGCRTAESVTVQNSYELPIIAYSSSEKDNQESCGDDVKNAHTVFTRFCVSDSGSVYSSEPSKGGSEASYECEGTFDPEYDINIFCHGPEWQGIAGRDKCISLYSKIIQSFKLH